jgi:alpha,alpha-trehalase
VRLGDGTLLNRYWDDRDTPRDESYREDVETARSSTRPPAELYRDLRAGAETGWDFSSRWLADGVHLDTIRTTALLPVDLNSLLAHMEQTLSLAYGIKGDTAQAKAYAARAQVRINAINRLMWRPDLGAFTDYVWTEHKPGTVLSAAMVLPLFFRFASMDQAKSLAATIRAKLLSPGGMATTRIDSGQQWDSPNGWAPIQWMAVIGLRAYGQDDLAKTIAQRWIEREIAAYTRTGVLLEKYNVKVGGAAVEAGAAGGHGGEYPLQVGFGWTNGVLATLMDLYPDRAVVSLEKHPQAENPQAH